MAIRLFNRETIEPAPFKDVFIKTKHNSVLRARYLVGLKGFIGWYVRDHKGIYSQKDLEVKEWRYPYKTDWKFYLSPKECNDYIDAYYDTSKVFEFLHGKEEIKED